MTFNKGIAIGYYIFIQVLVLLDVGKTLPASTVTNFDAIWIPMVICLPGMVIGYLIGREHS